MRRRAAIAVVALALWHHSVVAEDARDVLVVAKYAGFCGAIVGMYNFQKATQMPGGDEFLARFLTTEAARLGTSLDKIVSNCQASISSYDEMMAMPLEK